MVAAKFLIAVDTTLSLFLKQMCKLYIYLQQVFKNTVKYTTFSMQITTKKYLYRA
jgi:hypothetical protein